MSLPIITNNVIQQGNILTLNHQMGATAIPIATAISHNSPAIGDAAAAAASLPLVQNVVGNASPAKPVPTATATATASATEPFQVLSKGRLNDLVRDIDPMEQLDEEVEDILVMMADDFVENLLNGACLLAKHRHVNTIEVKDIELHLSRNYNMWVPGMGTDELRAYKRSFCTESHKQRINLIRRALKKY